MPPHAHEVDRAIERNFDRLRLGRAAKKESAEHRNHFRGKSAAEILPITVLKRSKFIFSRLCYDCS
jgi:hypothetical protein